MERITRRELVKLGFVTAGGLALISCIPAIPGGEATKFPDDIRISQKARELIERHENDRDILLYQVQIMNQDFLKKYPPQFKSDDQKLVEEKVKEANKRGPLELIEVGSRSGLKKDGTYIGLAASSIYYTNDGLKTFEVAIDLNSPVPLPEVYPYIGTRYGEGNYLDKAKMRELTALIIPLPEELVWESDTILLQDSSELKVDKTGFDTKEGLQVKVAVLSSGVISLSIFKPDIRPTTPMPQA